MLLRQLKPSILTVAGLIRNFTGAQPPPLLRVEAEDCGGEGAASGIASIGTKFLLLNCES